MNNSGNVAEVSLELKLKRTSRAKYEGTIGSFKRMDKRLIPEQSVRKVFRASGIDHLSEGGSRHDTKPNARIFGIKDIRESQDSILWNCGLWAHHVG